MKKILIPLTLAIITSFEGNSQNTNSNNKKGNTTNSLILEEDGKNDRNPNINNGNGRQNWFPNRGNVGIGTRTPRYNLEVIGNIGATNTIFAKTLEVGAGISAWDLTLLNNAIINGKLGIGTASPSEKLDLFGNAKISGWLQAASITAEEGNFTRHLSVQSLDVGQNATIGGDLTVTGTLSAPSTQFGELTTENLTVTNNMSVNGEVLGDLTIENNVNSSTGTFDKVGIGVENPRESLEIRGNAKVSGSIQSASVSTGQGSFSQGVSMQSLNVAQNTAIGGNLDIGGMVSGDLKVEGKVTSQTSSFGKVGIGTINPTESLEVIGNTIVSGSLQATTVNANQGNFNNTVSAQGLDISGNSTIGGNLQINGSLEGANINIQDINTNNLTVGQNLIVNGQVQGDLEITGNIKAGIIEASEFRTLGEGSIDMDNATIGGSLKIATNTLPENYKLAVGGLVIATGIDIKIPEKWPDYVFQKGYQLRSIKELDRYIKEHGHLPNIPSASEMGDKKHYSLSEMDTRLLETIEQLTLYVIQLKQEIEGLKSDLKSNPGN